MFLTITNDFFPIKKFIGKLKLNHTCYQKKESKLGDFLRRRIASTTTLENVGVEQVEEIVIDRVDDVVKSANDVHAYR